MNQERLERIHKAGLSYTGDASKVPYHPGFNDQCGTEEQYAHWITELSVYYAYLYGLVRSQQAKVVVELGRLYGGSTLAMLLALPQDGHIASLDLTNDYPHDCLRDVSDPRLYRLLGSSLDSNLSNNIASTMGSIDLLFIDTDHNYKQISGEWKIWRPFVKPGGLIVLDDIHLNPEMEQFWNEITEPKVDTGLGLHSSGFGLIGVP